MSSQKRINWKKDVIVEAEKFARDYYSKYNAPPTLRAIFYALVSKNVIPNTKSAYKRLSAVLSQARYNGEFSWRLIKDETRIAYQLEPDEFYETTPLTEEDLLELLKSKIDSRFDVEVNPWVDQEYRVLVILEKQALAESVKNVIRDAFSFGVYELRVIRGYNSASDMWQIARKIGLLCSEGHRVAILMLTDFDPSGEDIIRDFRKRILMLVDEEYHNNIFFEKIAIKAEHIKMYNIPPTPESVEELEKLRRDPRFKKFLAKIQNDPVARELYEQHGVIRAELDALLALAYEQFKKLIKDAIEKYWDQNTYENVTKKRLDELKQKAEEAKKKTYEALSRLLAR